MPAINAAQCSARKRPKRGSSDQRPTTVTSEKEYGKKQPNSKTYCGACDGPPKLKFGCLHFHLPGKRTVKRQYEGDTIQIAVALVIFANFIVACTSHQMMPEKGSPADLLFAKFEVIFGLIFTVELVANMYGSWMTRFWTSAWNLFDFVIVVISILSILFENLPGISVLRLFRAFRVFRLFKRVASLKRIIDGIVSSGPKVANAFAVLFILMGIWSIIGVEFYGRIRNQQFGTFSDAFLTMWQLMSMDSWASNIARGIIFDDDMPMASLYFISYLVIAGIIVANVVVGTVLDSYMDASKEMDDGMSAISTSAISNHLPYLQKLDVFDLSDIFQLALGAKGEKLKTMKVGEMVELVKIMWEQNDTQELIKELLEDGSDNGTKFALGMVNKVKTSRLLDVLLEKKRETTGTTGEIKPLLQQQVVESPNTSTLPSIVEMSPIQGQGDLAVVAEQKA